MLTVNVDEIDVPKYQRELVYIDYRDCFDPDQVESIIHGGYCDHTDEWISERQWESASDVADELLPDGHTDADKEAMMERLYELDESTPYQDLLRNTGSILFRYSPDEDGMTHLCDELEDPTAALEALGLGKQFLPAVHEILPEIAGYQWEGGNTFGASFIFSCDPSDLCWHEKVTITDPFLWITNPWSGNGYGVVAEGCKIERPVEDIHDDSHAWGYGADDVCGGLILGQSTVEKVA